MTRSHMRPDRAKVSTPAPMVCLGVWALCALAAARPAQAVEVQSPRWGFGGRVVPGRMNLLSVRVRNDTERSWDGTLVLTRGARHGVAHEQPCYLSPRAERNVQFLVYVWETDRSWSLRWGGMSGQQMKVPAPKPGPPAVVFLEEPGRLVGPTQIRAFPPGLLPGSVAAFDGLHALVLDRAPRRLSRAQQQALLDWVRGGGLVHLVQGPDEEYPAFRGLLDALNSPQQVTDIGAGQVVRHPIDRKEATEEELARRGYASPVLETHEEAPIHDLKDMFFGRLQAMEAVVEHKWGSMMALSVLYVLVVGPINWWLGARRRLDWRLVGLFFLVAVAGFGVAFEWTGRRGYGERTLVRSLAYARSVGPGRWDLTQWSSVFVVEGDRYEVTHAADQNFYEVFDPMDRVPGYVRGGPKGAAAVDIPIFSSRAVLHRACLEGPTVDASRARWTQGRVSVPVSEELARAFARGYLYRDEQFYELSVQGERVISDAYPRRNVVNSPAIKADDWSYGYYRGPRTLAETSDEYRVGLPALMVRALGGAEELHYQLKPRPTRPRLFLFARLPDAFDPESASLEEARGYVLYDVPLPRPQAGGDQ